jgi:GntR family transcriptional regulator, transcriptional repressor for pyruvate dehydrogenase complex
MPFARLAATPNLADQVASALRGQVQSGAFAHEAKLPSEAELATQFGVSRTVVREAVSRLKSDGLLTSRQGAGVFVHAGGAVKSLKIDFTSIASAGSALQVVEVRRALEAESAGLAAERATRAQIAQLKGVLKAIDTAVARGEDGVREDVAFHRTIAEMTGNPYYIAVLEFFSQYLFGVTRVTRANEARRNDFFQQVRAEHALIVAAIAAGDPVGARAAAASHMSNAADRINEAGQSFWQSHGGELVNAIPPPRRTN